MVCNEYVFGELLFDSMHEDNKVASPRAHHFVGPSTPLYTVVGLPVRRSNTKIASASTSRAWINPPPICATKPINQNATSSEINV